MARTIEIHDIEYLSAGPRYGDQKMPKERRGGMQRGHTAGTELADATSVKYTTPSAKIIFQSAPRPPGTMNQRSLMV